ncbi:hypothetical protein HK100_007159, partial [Physocladia obscura]
MEAILLNIITALQPEPALEPEDKDENEGGRWWIRGIERLHKRFLTFSKLHRPANFNAEDEDADEAVDPEEKLARFVSAVCTHQLAWCVDAIAAMQEAVSPHPKSWWTWPFRFVYYSIFPANLSVLNVLGCPTRPPTFYHFCSIIQLVFYSTVLCLRLIPPRFIKMNSTVRNFDRLLFSFVLPIVNGAVWLPVFIVPRSRTKFNAFDPAIFSSLSLSPASSSLTPLLPSVYTIVPGLSPQTRIVTSFWGSWVFGGIYTGPVLIWWFFNICNRTAIGFYNWQTDQDVATADERVSALKNSDTSYDSPADNDFDGRMGGGRIVGWLRRMWTRFAGVLVYSLWTWYLYASTNGFVREGESKLFASGFGSSNGYFNGNAFKIHVGTDVGVDAYPGLLWMGIGVTVPGMVFAVWLNFLNYQHRLVVWRERVGNDDSSGVVGLVVDEEDDELK